MFMRHDEILGLLPRLAYGIDDHPAFKLLCYELLFWIAVIILTITLVRLRPGPLERLESRIRIISEHRRFWLAGFGLMVIGVRLAALPWLPVPVPVIHDEFSYLLASDTFAHGRVTNPASPMWVHFESFHINVRPTYQSMYPPAQGFALALGQKLTGVPWLGVLLSVAVMCSAIYWMLLGWLPAPWAWLGGAFACVRFGIFSYWVNSYWGGAMAALGGALVLGALPRLRKRLTIQVALVFAAGLLILANSRPLEGFLFSLPLVISLLVSIVKSGRINLRWTTKAVLPAVGLLAIGAAWMLYYNWRGTGNALLMPYELNLQKYHVTQPFFFQKPHPIPQYDHLSMRAFYVYHELPYALRWKIDAAYFTQVKASVYYAFFLWPALLLLIASLRVIARSEARVVLLGLALMVAGMFAELWPPEAHYAAPATGALLLMLLYGVHSFRSVRKKGIFDYGVWGSQAVVIVLALWMMSPVAEALQNPYMIRPVFKDSGEAAIHIPELPAQFQRARIESELKARGGRHLVIVAYPIHMIPEQEWVYNDADINNSPVIWARDMGYLENQELVDYYHDRQVWYVDRGDPGAHLLSYEQVTAPLKMAFEYQTPETQSQGRPDSGKLAVVAGAEKANTSRKMAVAAVTPVR
jgi:hypothetical protein